MRVLALQTTTEVHVGLGAGGIVVDEQAVLDVLAGIGEVGTELGQVATGAVVGGGLGNAHGLAAEAGLGSADGGVTTDLEGDLGTVNGGVVPLLDEEDGHLGTVTDAEGPVLTETGHTTVTNDDGGLGMVADLDDHVVVAGDLVVVTIDGDLDRNLELGLGRDDQTMIDGVRVGCGQSRQTVLRGLGQVIQLAGSQVGDGDALGPPDVDVDDVGLLARLESELGEDRGEGLDRGEPPDLLTPGGHGMIGDLPRRGGVQMGFDVVLDGDVVALSGRGGWCAQRSFSLSGKSGVRLGGGRISRPHPPSAAR